MRYRRLAVAFVGILLLIALAGCNLGTEPPATETLTPTETPSPTGTQTLIAPTLLPTIGVFVPTASFPTAIIQIPTAVRTLPPPAPIRIAIYSPVPGSIVAGSVPVLGSAIHPQFLQYQVEYGPDPNPTNLWYPVTPMQYTPVQDGLLGVWNTQGIPDGAYALRLRVYLRDGTTLSTISNNINVRNGRPTPIPSATLSVPRPTAAFSQSATLGEVPLTVRFVNQSTGSINSIQWNFGDGTTSTEVSPVHTYNRAGLYNVNLLVAGPGGSSNVTSQVLVNSPSAPRAAFTATPTSGNAPLTVQFTDQSTGTISSYFWNFGDGQTSTERSPAHVFQAIGTYNVFLTVTGPGGVAIASRQITVQNPSTPAPVASFTFNPTTGNAPLNVQFVNTTSGNVTAYTWNFGDGTISTETSPAHVYSFPGTYTVTLIAGGPGGQSTATGTVNVIAPSATPSFTPTLTTVPASATPTFTATVTASQTLTLTPTATSTVLPSSTDTQTATPTSTATLTETSVPPSLTLTPTQTETPIPPTLTETPVPPTLTFTPTLTETLIPPSLTFTPTLTETPVPPTLTETPVPATATFTSTPLPPAVSFTPVVADPLSAPLTVAFMNNTTGDGLTGFQWDFGDGTTSTETNPVHAYAAGGSYTVTLTATGAGGSSSQQQVVTVTAPVSAEFSSAVNPSDPLTVSFTSLSTGPVASYFWDFGDGGIATDQNPTHTYAAGGTYNVTLTVTAADGVTSSSILHTVSVSAPLAVSFTAAPLPDNPLAYQFSSSASGAVTGYLWDFGDGQTSNEANPTHVYPGANTYAVTLTVSGSAGETPATTSQSITVTAPTAVPTTTTEPVTADFTAVVSPTDPATFDFAATGSGPIASYSWSFGDGTTGTDQVVSHTFTPGATYTVTLTATASDGVTTATSSQDVTVQSAATPTETQPGPAFSLVNQNGNVYALAWSPSGGLLAAGSSDGSVTIFDAVSQGTIVGLTGGHSDIVAAVAWNPSGTVLASGAADGSIALWDTATWSLITTLSGSGSITALEFNPSGSVLASASSDGSIVLWDTATNNPITQLQAGGYVYALSWIPSGNQLAYGDSTGTVTVFDAVNMQPFFSFTVGGSATALDYGIDGTRLAVGSNDGTGSIVETTSWSTVAVLVGHSGGITSLSYRPSGAVIATGSDDGTVMLWDAFSGTAMPPALPTGDPVVAVAWSSDSVNLASASATNIVSVWQP